MATENDKAWEHFIIEKKLSLDGSSYHVSASDLKLITKREPRLLAKFDYPNQMPRILRENRYSILAITNGSYLLFRGNIFAPINNCAVRSTFTPSLPFPLVTIGRGSSESQYIDNAFNTGILGDFVDKKDLFFTIRGRERTRHFQFNISAISGAIAVNGVQIEVDAGYESEQDIILVEAKIGPQSHFNIRQLYYPFRHFKMIAPHKRIRTMIFIYDLHNATYSFHEFEFPDPSFFDSIRQSRCCIYTLTSLAPYKIDQLMDPHFTTTSQNVPQANDLNKILELLALINSGQNTVTDIADYFVFDERQSNYYGEAAEYLGLISRNHGVFELTECGSKFISIPPNEQQVFIAKTIINSWIFKNLITQAREKGYFTITDIGDVIASARKSSNEQHYAESTIRRRQHAIIAWAKWLARSIQCFRIDGNSYYLT